MINSVIELETSLREQLASLSANIRTAESSLISTKEGYLKVQGALEILDILKQKIEKESSESLAVATD